MPWLLLFSAGGIGIANLAEGTPSGADLVTVKSVARLQASTTVVKGPYLILPNLEVGSPFGQSPTSGRGQAPKLGGISYGLHGWYRRPAPLLVRRLILSIFAGLIYNIGADLKHG